MGVPRPTHVTVAVAAAGLAVLIHRQPELLLNTPFLGFYLFSLAGGNDGYIPAYINHDLFIGKNFDEWVKDGDVIVAAGAKSGTTWMCYCSDAIRRKGSDKVGLPYTDIMYSTPWLEMVQRPGLTWQQTKELYNTTILKDGTRLKDYWDHRAFPFRIFKSHFGPETEGGHWYSDVLQVKSKPKVKFIAVARNPYEVVRSFWSFLPAHRPEFRKMWGDFPPPQPDREEIMRDVLPGGRLYPLYFPYVRAWWGYKDEPNVLLMHYSDMVKDTGLLVARLSRFLNVELTNTEFDKVVEKCSFDHMKNNSHLFDYQLPLNPGFGSIMYPSQFVNSGKATGAAEWIGPELLEEFDRAAKIEFPDAQLLHWAFQGGSFDPEVPQ